MGGNVAPGFSSWIRQCSVPTPPSPPKDAPADRIQTRCPRVNRCLQTLTAASLLLL